MVKAEFADLKVMSAHGQQFFETGGHLQHLGNIGIIFQAPVTSSTT